MSHKKLQIALEFMILFSFVLIVFLFLFAMISVQRAQTLSSQIFSQEQLIAQSISMQLDRALQSGNGYIATIPITGVIGTLNYHLIITKNGAVVINASVGKETIQAIAYSSVKNVVSNPSFLMANTLYYLVPIANGTIKIQNAFGNVCVDYACPTSSVSAANVSLTSQITHVANFNGQTSYINIGNSILYNTGVFSVSFWVQEPSYQIRAGLVNKGSAGSSKDWYFITSDNTCIGTAQGVIFDAGPTEICYNWGDSNWHFVVGVYNSNTRQESLYVDSAFVGLYTGSLRFTPQIYPVIIGAESPSLTSPFLGSISNLQIYNIALSQDQAQQLYSEGISGQPLSSNLIGWWPLNGNSNDYTGNGNNNIVGGPLLYTTTAQLFAKATSQQNYGVKNTIVGFSSTIGSFMNAPSISSATDTSGSATSFLNQQGINGQALVSAEAFNGNTLYRGNLIGWWPMDMGQGNTIYDLSGNGNNGAMNGGAYWSMPNYISGFDGVSSYVATPYLQNSVTAYTLSAWIKSTSPGGVIAQDRILNSGNSLTLGFGPAGCGVQSPGQAYFCDDSNGIGIGVNSIAVVNDGKWHMLTGTWGASGGSSILPSPQFSIYIDGQRVKTNAFTRGSDKSPLTGAGGTLIGFHPIWNNYFSGSMSNIQAYNSILSANQIQSLYQQGIAGPPLSGNIVGWWPLGGDANDYSGYGSNGTVFGNLNPLSTSSIPNANSNATSFLAASFNGIGSIISPLTQNSISSFTITLWVNPANVAKMISNGNGYTVFNSYGANNFEMWLNNGGPLGASPGSGDEEVGFGSNVYHGYGISNSSWNFIAIAVSNGKVSFYANAAPPYDVSTIAGPYSINALAIAQQALSMTPFNGLIANVQVYNSTLTGSQISQIYKQGVSGMPLNSTSTNYKILLWWPLNGNANDYSRNGNNGATANVVYVPQQSVNPYLLSSPSGYGVNFNGQSGYIQSSFTVGNTFTLSFWLRKGGYAPNCESVMGKPSSTQMVINSPTQNGCNAGSEQNTPLVFDYVDSGGASHDLSTTSPLPAFVWEHAVATFNGISGNMSWYVNGVNTKTYTGLNPINTNANPFKIGYGDTNMYFNGTIANVQFYNIDLSAAQIKQLYQNAMPPSASITIPMSWVP